MRILADGYLPEPVVVLDHLSETQRRAYIIADNKLALNAGWDEKVLAAELRELEGEGLDLAVVGFSDGRVNWVASSAVDGDASRVLFSKGAVTCRSM